MLDVDMARLEERLKAMLDNAAESHARIEAKLKHFEERLVGNGSEGIIVRLDRIERFVETRKKLEWLIASSAITACIAACVSVVGLFMQCKG
jgi:hypothetical protein